MQEAKNDKHILSFFKALLLHLLYWTFSQPKLHVVHPGMLFKKKGVPTSHVCWELVRYVLQHIHFKNTTTKTLVF